MFSFFLLKNVWVCLDGWHMKGSKKGYSGNKISRITGSYKPLQKKVPPNRRLYYFQYFWNLIKRTLHRRVKFDSLLRIIFHDEKQQKWFITFSQYRYYTLLNANREKWPCIVHINLLLHPTKLECSTVSWEKKSILRS